MDNKEKMMNSISMTCPASLRLIAMAPIAGRPMWVYENGQPTETPRTAPDGWQLFRYRGLQAAVGGEATEIDVVMPMDITLSGLRSFAVAEGSTLRIRATSQEGTSYATLVFTVETDGLEPVGDLCEALGLKAAA